MINKPTLLIDIDEVLRPFVQPLLNCYNRIYKTSFKFENIKEYNIVKVLTELKDMNGFQEFVSEHREEIYMNTRPYKDVKAPLLLLASEYHITLLTSVFNSGIALTKVWLKINDIYYDELIFDHHKEKYEGFAMIDDGIHNLETTKAKYRILINRPWNESYIGSVRFDSLKDASKFILNELNENKSLH